MATSSFGAAVARAHAHQKDQQEDFLRPISLRLVADWKPSLDHVLEHEGGNDDDPRDPGGRTSRGIIQSEWTVWRKTHPGLPADVWQAPQDQVEAIYKAKYWTALGCDDLPAGVDYCVFDYGVNSGIGRAQRILASIHASDPVVMIHTICDERLRFLQGLSTWGTFGRGWGRRVAEVRRDALAMAAKPTPRAFTQAPAPAPSLPPVIPTVNRLDLGHAVKRVMLGKGYPWFPDQNVVSIERMDRDGTPNELGPNTFRDIKTVVDGEGKIIGGPWTGTTHPGTYWTVHPMASGGAFIIALGAQSCWTPGAYHGHTVWRQAEDSTILGHRDPDCTYVRQGAAIKHSDIGVHHHGGYNLPRNNIANAAAGCQVVEMEDAQQEFMDITLKCPRYLADRNGYRLTATVLTQEEVVAAMIASPAPAPAPSRAPQPSSAPTSKPPTSEPAPAARPWWQVLIDILVKWRT